MLLTLKTSASPLASSAHVQKKDTTSLIHSPRSLQFLPAAAYKDTTPHLWSTTPDCYTACLQQPTRTPHHTFDPLLQIVTLLACSSLQGHHTTSLIHSHRSLQFLPAAAYKDTTPHLWSTPPDCYTACLQQPTRTPHHIFDPLIQIVTLLACSSLQGHHTTSLIHSSRLLHCLLAAAYKDTTPHIWSTPPDCYTACLQQPTRTPHHTFDPLLQIVTLLACSSLQGHHTTSLIHSSRLLHCLPAAAYKDTTPHLWSPNPDCYTACLQQPTRTPHHIFDPLLQIVTLLACSSLQGHHTTYLIHYSRLLHCLLAATYKDTTPHLWSTPPDCYTAYFQQPTRTPHHIFDPLLQIVTLLACSSLQGHHTTYLIHYSRLLHCLLAAAYKDTIPHLWTTPPDCYTACLQQPTRTPHIWSTPPDCYTACLQQPTRTPHHIFDPLLHIVTLLACSSLQGHHTTSLIHSSRLLHRLPAAAYNAITNKMWDKL